MEKMFWVIVWAISFALFLLVPLLCVPENRRRIYLRIKLRKWNVQAELAQANAAAEGGSSSNNAEGAAGSGNNDSNGFHYVLSRAQEDEIRQSFLTENLEKYTLTLQPESIQRLRSDTVTTATSSLHGSGELVSSDLPSSQAPGGSESEEAVDLEAGSAQHALPNVGTKKTSSADETTVDEDDYACSSDDGLSDDGLEMDEFIDDSSMIVIPSAISKICTNAKEAATDADAFSHAGTRTVPNGCAICLTTFDAGDRIAYSANCNHVFHAECMMDWLVASGRKHLKRQRREERNMSGDSHTAYRYNCQDPIEKILNFPMNCPCCRQPFVTVQEEETEDNEDDNDSVIKPARAVATTTTTSADIEAPPTPNTTNAEEDPAEATATTTTTPTTAAPLASPDSTNSLAASVNA